MSVALSNAGFGRRKRSAPEKKSLAGRPKLATPPSEHCAVAFKRRLLPRHDADNKDYHARHAYVVMQASSFTTPRLLVRLARAVKASAAADFDGAVAEGITTVLMARGEIPPVIDASGKRWA